MSIVQRHCKKLYKAERTDPKREQIFVDYLQKVRIVLISLNLLLNAFNDAEKGKKEGKNGVTKIGEQLENGPMTLLVGDSLCVFRFWTCEIGERRVIVKALILDNFPVFTHGEEIGG